MSFSSGEHWYDSKTGEPRYTVVGANGKKRNTTLADARKHGYVPSVTTIAKAEAKPQLTTWLVHQGMLACLTLPRNAGESDSEFISRALADSQVQVKDAADRGTYLHDLLEKCIKEGAWGNVSDEDRGYVLPVLSWIYQEFPGYEWHAEKSFASNGYGGKVDLSGTHPTKPPVVLDYKCKNFDDPGKKLAYDEHCSQLTAYGKGLGYKSPRLINIFISSTVPGLFVTKEWTPEEQSWGWKAFAALRDLWYARKKLSTITYSAAA